MKGPEFRAVSTVEADEVWSGLHHALEARDFKVEVLPAGEQVFGTVNGAEEKLPQTRYTKTLPDIGTLKVDAVLSEVHIRTFVRWYAWTDTEDPITAGRLAAGTALAIDEIFGGRMETNLIPKEERKRVNRDLWKASKKR